MYITFNPPVCVGLLYVLVRILLGIVASQPGFRHDTSAVEVEDAHQGCVRGGVVDQPSGDESWSADSYAPLLTLLTWYGGKPGTEPSGARFGNPLPLGLITTPSLREAYLLAAGILYCTKCDYLFPCRNNQVSPNRKASFLPMFQRTFLPMYSRTKRKIEG